MLAAQFLEKPAGSRTAQPVRLVALPRVLIRSAGRSSATRANRVLPSLGSSKPTMCWWRLEPAFSSRPFLGLYLFVSTLKLSVSTSTCPLFLSSAQVRPKNGLELKAGSRRHQHIVGFEEPRDGKTRFALVALDLPADLDKDSGKSD